MHRAVTARWLGRALSIAEASPMIGVPFYLCPALAHPTGLARLRLASASTRPPVRQRRLNHTAATTSDASSEAPLPPPAEVPTTEAPMRRLPLTCTGCGAFTQTVDPEQFGYFNLESKRVRTWLNKPKQREVALEEAQEDQLVDEVLNSIDSSKLEELGIDMAGMSLSGSQEMTPAPTLPPVCERCHNLLHHEGSGSSKLQMHHPTVESLRATIEESPHKYNHVYHIVDAADFPMSLIPSINGLLGDIPMRSKNRRSRTSKFQHDRKIEISFIITRSDLLGPTKEIVDSLMPYLREVLRDALGRTGERARLGNVRCVSAKRNWWTKELREDIWNRGGAGWMVGKVNVGKSMLFELIYPKGRMGNQGNLPSAAAATSRSTALDAASTAEKEVDPAPFDDVQLGDLLPPVQPAQMYPAMPIVSSVPGTTASPIRVPFGNGKGELIDLPGLARSDLENYVVEDDRKSLIMSKRIVPKQLTIKPQQSLVLAGGLIRITPRTPDMMFLMYNFTPMSEHVTATEKAVGFQDQSRTLPGPGNIMMPGVGDKMQHAGTYEVRHDVTKARAGPLTRKDALGFAVEKLPFRVLSIDILIEGVGYVEVVVQVRASQIPTPVVKRDVWEEMTDRIHVDSRAPAKKASKYTRQGRSNATPQLESEGSQLSWPAVDVYTPGGRFVASRFPINGWQNNKPLVLAKHKKVRPRKSMTGEKQRQKGREAKMGA